MADGIRPPSTTNLQGETAAEELRTEPTATAQEGREDQQRPHAVMRPTSEEPKAHVRERPSLRRRLLLLTLIVGLLVVGLSYGIPYYHFATSHEWTDNAFIEGHVIQVSPQVAGHILHVHVADNQEVQKGDLLVELDPRDYAARLSQAHAALQAAKAKQEAAQSSVELTQITAGAGVEQAAAGVEVAQAAVQTARVQVEVSRAQVEQARAQTETAVASAAQANAQVVAVEAEAMRVAADVRRLQELSRRDQISRQEFDHVRAEARAANAQLESARKRAAAAEAQVNEARAAQQMATERLRQAQSEVAEAQARVGEAVGRLAAANAAPHEIAASRSQSEVVAAEIEQARAAVTQAELELSYTHIHAPESGRVTRKVVEAGAYVQVGQALLAVVPAHVWVVANFKETQLTFMRPGQPAEIEVDAYPRRVFRGHVDSIQAGTGSRFSLLPPENATGNFIKVVQRVPVKIVFNEPPDPQYLLAPGMSVVPVVTVR